MGRTDSTETRKKILQAAEECFAEKGFDATGIELISSKSGTNKALIYYHFKNKQGLLNALYIQALDEIKSIVAQRVHLLGQDNKEQQKDTIKAMLNMLKKRKALMKILLMESLKGGESQAVFMDFARKMMEGELSRLHGKEKLSYSLVYEFFTGFVPLFFYTVISSDCASHFAMEDKQMEEYFIESFVRSHISHHH